MSTAISPLTICIQWTSDSWAVIIPKYKDPLVGGFGFGREWRHKRASLVVGLKRLGSGL